MLSKGTRDFYRKVVQASVGPEDEAEAYWKTVEALILKTIAEHPLDLAKVRVTVPFAGTEQVRALFCQIGVERGLSFREYKGLIEVWDLHHLVAGARYALATEASDLIPPSSV